ncbi:MAG: hypothetical protein ACI4PK_02490 [Oscillospiraceae bacterium]
MVKYGQIRVGPELWHGAKSGADVFSGNSTSIGDSAFKYAGVETLGKNGKLEALSKNLLSTEVPCSGYVGTQVKGSTVATEYLPVYFTGSTDDYVLDNSSIIYSLNKAEEVPTAEIKKIGDSQNGAFAKPKKADETDVDVFEELRANAPSGATTEYFDINWGNTPAGFYTLVLRDESGNVVCVAPFYHDAVEPEFENITYKLGAANEVKVANGISSVTVTGSVS